jgi:hypothetical protein
MKKPTWNQEFLQQLGDDIAQFGINLTWNRQKLNPNDRVNVSGEDMSFFAAMMKAVTEAEGMTVTHARRSMEDVLSMALRAERPNEDWANVLFKHGAHWRCAQGWTEKQAKRMLDNLESSKVAMAERWKNLALNDDQAIAMDKTIAYYQNMDAKAQKKGKTSTSTPPQLFGASFTWPVAKN